MTPGSKWEILLLSRPHEREREREGKREGEKKIKSEQK